MRFFFDNCVSPKLASAIGELSEYEVDCLRKKFPANTPDTEWIRQLAAEGGWIVISADNRIYKAPQELEAWRQAKLTGFFCAPAWSKNSLWDQAWRLVRWWPKIEAQAELAAVGSIFELPLKHTSKFRQITIRPIKRK